MVRSSRGKLTTGGWEEVGDKMEDDMEVDDEGGGGQHLLGPKNPLKTIEAQGGGISRPSESFDFIGYGFYIR